MHAVTKSGVAEQQVVRLDRSGAISCWGSNAHGQLGDGTSDRRTTPVRVAW